jgi:hypothetical protein
LNCLLASFSPTSLEVLQMDNVGPFLKEPVKGKRFLSGFLRNGSARRTFPIHPFVGHDESCPLTVITCSDPSRLSSLREVAIVLFKRDCSQHIPSQGTAHDSRGQLRPVTGQMRIYLVRIPRRKGHSIQSIVLLAAAIAGRCRRIHGPTRVGPNGRDLKLPQGNPDRTTGPNLTHS